MSKARPTVLWKDIPPERSCQLPYGKRYFTKLAQPIFKKGGDVYVAQDSEGNFHTSREFPPTKKVVPR